MLSLLTQATAGEDYGLLLGGRWSRSNRRWERGRGGGQWGMIPCADSFLQKSSGGREQEPVLLWRDQGAQGSECTTVPRPGDPLLVALTHLTSYSSSQEGERWESSSLALLWAEEYKSLLYKNVKKGKWWLSPRGRHCGSQLNLGI